MVDSPAIKLNGLSKRFNDSKTFALRDVSLQVMPGEIYGFLGSNGAGKSTTIRLLMGFIQPTKGSATILGNDIVAKSVAVKKNVGYLAGDVHLYSKMNGKQFLHYMATLQPLKRKGYLPELVKRFEVDLRKPIENLSKGNRQKLGVLQAMMHEPDILILDEPTSGLDPLMQEAFFLTIREAKERGASVFLSSHNFAEVQRMCDRVGFLRDGKLVAEETLADLAAKAAHTFDIMFADQPPLAELQRIRGAHVVPYNTHHVRLSLQGELTPLLQVLARHRVTRLDQREVDLEDQFLRFYGKERS